MRWIVFDLHFQTKDIVLMMDNLSIYKTKKIIKFLNKTGWIVNFIPPYKPTFAPVKRIFNILNLFENKIKIYLLTYEELREKEQL